MVSRAQAIRIHVMALYAAADAAFRPSESVEVPAKYRGSLNRFVRFGRASRPPTTSLRILGWNVGGSYDPQMPQYLKAQVGDDRTGVDVALLQELPREVLDDPHFNNFDIVYGPEVFLQDGSHKGTAILSRIPLSEVGVIDIPSPKPLITPLGFPYANTGVYAMTAGDDPIQLGSAHLRLRANRQFRADQAEYLMDSVPEADRAFWVLDANTLWRSGPISFERGVADAFHSRGYRSCVKGIQLIPPRTIDRAFQKGALKAVTRFGSKKGSDHRSLHGTAEWQ